MPRNTGIGELTSLTPSEPWSNANIAFVRWLIGLVAALITLVPLTVSTSSCEP